MGRLLLKQRYLHLRLLQAVVSCCDLAVDGGRLSGGKELEWRTSAAGACGKKDRGTASRSAVSSVDRTTTARSEWAVIAKMYPQPGDPPKIPV